MPDRVVSRFDHLLRQHRADAGLSQEALAERAGLSPRAIYGLEHGETHPQRGTIERIVRALGLTAEQRAQLEDAARDRSGASAASPSSGSAVAASPTRSLPEGGTRGPPAPSGRTLTASALPLHNLPAQVTSFVGREDELNEVTRLLGSARLVTLTGAGGCGKTRLALAVAGRVLRELADGVFFVSLAPLREPGLVAETVARALGAPLTEPRPARESLAEFLRPRRLLLLLDNCEHLLDAAPLVSELLATCPGLTILATSRAALRLMGEHEHPVPPLPVPERGLPPEALTLNPAVALYCERALASAPSFHLTAENAAVVAETCIVLEGLPLAIELAVARLRFVTPSTLLHRLGPLSELRGGPRDAPARHQTMRAAIAWSDALLPDDARTLFHRLAVFAGGFSESAASAVAGFGRTPPQVDETPPSPSRSEDHASADPETDEGLEALVEQSLLRVEPDLGGEPRYRMLETIRSFAWERLEASGEAETIQRRHAAYYLGLAEGAVAPVPRTQDRAALGRLETDHDNLRAALRWGLQDRGDVVVAIRLACVLGRFWAMHGYLGEGRRWIEEARRQATAAPAPWRGRVHYEAGLLAFRQGDHERAAELFAESRSLQLKLGDRRAAARTIHALANVAAARGDPDRARELYAESLAVYREVGTVWDITYELNHLGELFLTQGRYDQARASLDEALQLCRSAGSGVDLPNTAVTTLNLLGRVALGQGDLDQAARRFAEGLASARELGDTWAEADLLHELAGLMRARGELERARTCYENSLALRRALRDPAGIGMELTALGAVALEQDDVGRAQRLLVEGLTVRRDQGDRASVADSLEWAAAIAAAQELPEGAVQLLAAASALRAALGARCSSEEVRDRERLAARLHATLGAAAFQIARERGQGLSLDEAIALAVRP